MPRMNKTPRKPPPVRRPHPHNVAFAQWVQAVNELIPRASIGIMYGDQFDCRVCGARIVGTFNQRKHWQYHNRSMFVSTRDALFGPDAAIHQPRDIDR